MNPVTEAGDVPDSALEERVLVAHEHAPDDPHELALLGRPVEQGSHDPFPLPREQAPRGVPFAGVLHVEGDIGGSGVRTELRRAERAESRLNGHQPLVEEVAGDPCGRDVVARLGRLLPAGARVHRVEGDVAALVDELDLREDGRLAAAEDGEADLDADRTANVCRGGLLLVLNDCGPSAASRDRHPVRSRYRSTHGSTRRRSPDWR